MSRVFVYFLFYALIQIVCSIVMGIAFGISGDSSQISSTQIILTSVVSNVIAIAIFVLARWTPFSLDFFKGKPTTIIYWSILIGLGMIIPTCWMEDLIPEALKTDILADQFKSVLADKWGYLAIGLMAPAAEELVFRGGIQKAAVAFFEERFNRPAADGSQVSRSNIPHWIGIILTAILFALIHGNPAQMPHAFLAGMLLGWLCYRSGSIIPGIVVHWVNNSAAFLLYNFYPQAYDMHTIDFFGNSVVRLGLATVFSLLLFVPAIYQIQKVMKRV